MEKKEYTIEEVLNATMNILSNLRIPAALVSEIGVPIENCIKNLQACVNAAKEETAMKKALKEMEETDDGREADPE